MKPLFILLTIALFASCGRKSRAAEIAPRPAPTLTPVPGSPVFIRAFKEERILELFQVNPATGKYELVRSYPIVAASGHLGPKLAEGDRQVPEGFYQVRATGLNPNSRYHLSFNIGFPNAFDRANHRTGSFIMIHGSNVSAGCLAMTDRKIEEIYALVKSAIRAGHAPVPVHIFPFRMTPGRMAKAAASTHLPFWQNLRSGYDLFENTSVPPTVTVRGKTYHFQTPSDL